MSKPDHSGTNLTIAGAAWFQAPGVRAVFRALNRDGHEARIVGGSVRNALMGLPVGDVDFATTAPPQEVVRLAREAGLKPVATGLKHGTITVVVDGRPFEVTTLREDVETHGRHATVKFTRDWESDAKRRDFTMNAMYADERGRVFDPLGGYADLKARRVYFIGVARERIREDYLRILRFFRFTAEYAEDGLDPVGVHACLAEREGLARLSAERVHAELMRILVAREPLRALEPMADGGFLTAILGGVVRVAHFLRMADLETQLALPPDPVRRFAALAVMVEEDVGRLAERLRLSNAETARLVNMAAPCPVVHPEHGELRAKEMLFRLGSSAYRDRVLIAWARDGAPVTDENWRALFTLPESWQPPEFPLKGQDLIANGMQKGPRVGEMMRKLEAEWIASGFTLSREALLRTVSAEACRDMPPPLAGEGGDKRAQ